MSQKSKNNPTVKRVRESYNQNTMGTGIAIPAGVYRGIVIRNDDPDGYGRIAVKIPSLNSLFLPVDSQAANGSSQEGQITSDDGAIWCQRLVPYGGNSEIGYGITSQPPEIDNTVLVAFSGESQTGIVLGVLPERTDSIGVGPRTRATVDGKNAPALDPSKERTNVDDKPESHPLASALETSGLGEDTIRGLPSSSPIRDSVQNMIGMSSKQGHAIILDDGDIEEDTNNQIRIRSSGGAQVVIDDNNGFIYINNQNGSGWIEINRNGDFDIFSAGSVNIHTLGTFNVHAKGNINFQSDRNFNVKAMGAEGIKLDASSGSVDIFAHANANITADSNGNLRFAGGMRVTAGRIDLNGAPALTASRPAVNNMTGNKATTTSITGRVPEREPWPGHLDGGSGAGTLTGGSGGDNLAPSNNPRPTTSFPISGTKVADGYIIFTGNANTEPQRSVNPELLEKMGKIFKEFGEPMQIISGNRGANSSVGAGRQSQHNVGNAADFYRLDWRVFSQPEAIRMVELAAKYGIEGIGAYATGGPSAQIVRYFHFDYGGRGYKTSWNGTGRDGLNKPFKTANLPNFIRPVLSRLGYIGN